MKLSRVLLAASALRKQLGSGDGGAARAGPGQEVDPRPPEEPREENEITSPPEDEHSPESSSEKETAQEEAEPKSEESDDDNVQDESVPPLETPDQDSTEQTQEIDAVQKRSIHLIRHTRDTHHTQRTDDT